MFHLINIGLDISIFIALINYIMCIKFITYSKFKKMVFIITITEIVVFSVILKIFDNTSPGLDYWHKNEIDIILKYSLKLIPFIMQIIIFIIIYINNKKGGKTKCQE